MMLALRPAIVSKEARHRGLSLRDMPQWATAAVFPAVRDAKSF